MPRGCRFIILAIAGLILVGAGKPPEKAAASPKPEASQAISEKVTPTSASVPPSVEANRPDTGCEHGQDRRDSDLCAQWKAADAATAAAQAAWWQFWLGVGGMVVGIATLGAAIAAAWFARAAANHTETGASEAKRAATAAEVAVEQTEETSRIQLQPYVFPEAVWLAEPNADGSRDLCLRLKNYGQTPAMYVDAQLGFSLQEYPLKRMPIQHGIEGPPLGTIPPGGNQVVKLGARRVHEHAWGQIRAGRMAFVAYIAIRYESRFRRGAQSWSGWYFSEGKDIDEGKFQQLTGRDAEDSEKEQ